MLSGPLCASVRDAGQKAQRGRGLLSARAQRGQERRRMAGASQRRMGRLLEGCWAERDVRCEAFLDSPSQDEQSYQVLNPLVFSPY